MFIVAYYHDTTFLWFHWNVFFCASYYHVRSSNIVFILLWEFDHFDYSNKTLLAKWLAKITAILLMNACNWCLYWCVYAFHTTFPPIFPLFSLIFQTALQRSLKCVSLVYNKRDAFSLSDSDSESTNIYFDLIPTKAFIAYSIALQQLLFFI